MTRSTRRPSDGVLSGVGGSRYRAGKPLSVSRNGALRPPRGGAVRVRSRPPRSAIRGARRIPASTYVLVAVVGVAALFAFKAVRHRATGHTAEAATTRPRTSSPSYTVDSDYMSQYQSRLDAYLATRPGKYAVASLDVTTGATLAVDADGVYRAASVNKLELLIDLYRRAVAHQLDLDTTTVISADDIQNYGTGTIQLQGPGQVYSWRELARLMVQESDNTASYVIKQRLGPASVQADLQSWGLKQTSIEDNTTSARDAALVLARLQRRELLPEAETSEILDMLQHTVWTDRLQSGVPNWLAVAHKIGTDVQVYNDAALFLDPQRPYIAVVLSSGDEEPDALATMTRVSQLVYQFEAGIPAASHLSR